MTEAVQSKAIAPPTLSPSDLDALDEFYSFRDRAEILPFLAQYPFLVPVLLEAPKKIRPYFPDSDLILELARDPEIIDYRQLILAISTNLGPDEAMDREDRLDEDLWGDAPYEVRTKMFTYLECQ